MKVALTVIAGPGVGTVMEFSEPRGFIIGRAEDADFRLPENDLYVSRHHAYLEVCPPNCRIRDLGATNPPLLNGQPVQEADLREGDTLELGYTHFKVSVNGGQEPLPPAHCLNCGEQIEVPSEGNVPELCGPCTSARLSAPVSPKLKQIARCTSCPTDLSGKANTDGRAAELEGIVAYCCEECLPKWRDDSVRDASIADFNLVRRLGEGGMGVVYLAHHSPTGRLVALKQVKGLCDTNAVHRFERESRIIQSLVHENVVRYLHTGTHKDGPFVVTEFVEGGDAEKLVQSAGGKLSCNDAVHIIGKVLDGVGYLHQREIIHRDIKPQNILIRMSEQKSYKVKLTDFGLAKCYGRAGGTRITRKNIGMGTLMYMPPEQVNDATGVREPADLYAVGVTLYYLLTGRYSFDFPTNKDIEELMNEDPEKWKSPQEALGWIMRVNRVKHPFKIILSGTPVPVRDRNASIPKRLAEVVDKAVQRDPRARYQSAAEFQAALKEFV